MEPLAQFPRAGFNFQSVIILASLLVFPILGCRHSLLRHCNISRFSKEECTFSNIPTCVHLQVGSITLQSVRGGAAGTCRLSRAVKTFGGILFLFSKIVHFRYIRKSETYLPVQIFVGSINCYTQYNLWTIFYHVTCLH